MRGRPGVISFDDPTGLAVLPIPFVLGGVEFSTGKTVLPIGAIAHDTNLLNSRPALFDKHTLLVAAIKAWLPAHQHDAFEEAARTVTNISKLTELLNHLLDEYTKQATTVPTMASSTSSPNSPITGRTTSAGGRGPGRKSRSAK